MIPTPAGGNEPSGRSTQRFSKKCTSNLNHRMHSCAGAWEHDKVFCFLAALMIKFILGSLSVLLWGGLCFLAGMFVSSFDDNQCYTKVIADIVVEAQAAVEIGDKVAKERLDRLLSILPLHGYESSCPEILVFIDAHRANSVRTGPAIPSEPLPQEP